MHDWKKTAKQMYKNHTGYKKIAARVNKTEDEVREFLKSEKTKQSEQPAAKNKPDKFTVFENLAPKNGVVIEFFLLD